MTLNRILLVGIVATCALAAWGSKPTIVDTHRLAREFVIRSTMDRVENPVVILGDSIVEASTLPRSICGHAIVNAGIGGASTTSQLEEMLKLSLNGKTPALIAVSLGSNDAAKPSSVAEFRSNYRTLLIELALLGSRVALVATPAPELGLDQSGKIEASLIEAYNQILPDLAKEVGATFIPLPPFPTRPTSDGIHLNANGYAVWDEAINSSVANIVCSTSRSTTARTT